MNEKLWYLKDSRLFEHLDSAEIEQLEAGSRMQVFPRKSLVYLPSDRGDAIFLLTSGRVRLYHVTSDGKETVLTFIESGEIFGELTLLGQTQREEFAEAMEKSTVVMIPGAVVQRLMETQPSFTLQLTRLMGLRRQRIERRLKSLLFRSNRERLVFLLLELAEKYGKSTPEGVTLGIRLSHQELASMIGSTRETVTVLLGELQLEGGLLVKRRQIILTNLPLLAGAIDELPLEIRRLVEEHSESTHPIPGLKRFVD